MNRSGAAGRRPAGRRGAVTIAVGLLAAALCAGCTAIPSSSDPQIVKSLAGGDDTTVPQLEGPTRDAQPTDIVNGFLSASGVDPVKQSSARAYLAPSARNTWSDTTVTIVSNERVGAYTPGSPITVSARIVGTLDADGTYTPVLEGTGGGGPPVPFHFGISRVGGQYRISSLRNGLVLTTAQFEAYKPRYLYFFGLTGDDLEPDPRYSPLSDPTQLAAWLLDQLGAGPSTSLAPAVSTDGFPAQSNLGRLAVTNTATGVRVEIPGAAQLAATGRDRLAAQVATTLAQAVSDETMTITDGGTPVRIPDAGGAAFTASEFGGVGGPAAPAPDVYYLRGGRVVGQRGRVVAGPLGDGQYYLDSVALAPDNESRGELDAAGVVGHAGQQQTLYVGTSRAGLAPTKIGGQLSRPSWAPGRAEVWVGDGRTLVRATVTGRTARATQVALQPAIGVQRIQAVRISPDGARIALVVSGPGSGGRLYAGVIVRGAGQVHVESLAPVSPDGVVITDLGWLDPRNLDAIGYLSGSHAPGVYETGVDGSVWRAGGISGLPSAPTSLAVAVLQPAWVAAGSGVYRQHGDDFTSPDGGSGASTSGSAPVYLE